MDNSNSNNLKNLFSAILLLDNIKECENFFDDICTIKELQDLSQRFQVVKMLNDGISYQEICKKTGASTTTISRVNRCLNYGKGGYSSILKKLNKKGEEK